ncbi:MAG: DUF3667 domain-containing protein [Sphingobacteriales bacterium]|nr:MAG: DUF3667 domain-containing protein [Sphingobacteriales bacterium]
MHRCLNCENKFSGRFCNNCGQKSNTHRFSVGHVLHELPHQIFHLDKGIFRNIASILHPRQTVTDYLSGRRVSYFNPLLFYFLTLGLILFLESVLGTQAEIMMDVGFETGKDEYFKYDASAWFMKNIKFIYFGFSFLIAFPNYLLFKETRFNYAEQVIASTFILGYVNIGYLLFIFFPFIDGYPVNYAAAALFLLFTGLIYYRGKLWLTALKTVFSLVVNCMVILLTVLVLWFINAVVHSIFG